MEETRPHAQLRWKTIAEVSVLLCVLSVLAAILFPTINRSREDLRRSSCQSNLKQIMLSVKQYIADYDQTYPLVIVGSKADFEEAGSTFGWADVLEPYRRSLGIFQCPSEKVPPTKHQMPQPQTEGLENRNAVVLVDNTPLYHQYTDYWFNARASGAGEKQIQRPAQTILLGDGNDGIDSTNARYHLLSIPTKWRKDEESPLYRHLDGANFAFADGHVKWFKADKWNSKLDATNGYTLRLKPKN